MQNVQGKPNVADPWLCEDCDATAGPDTERQPGEYETGCPKCGETMVPNE